MYYPNKLTLIAINKNILKRSGREFMGIQYSAGLDIVTQQPKQVLFGRELYPTIWLKAAFILQKITKKYIFTDGNKRTAMAATAFFLYKNNYCLDFSKDEGLKFIMCVTTSEDTEKVMGFAADWLKIHSKKL